MLKSEAGTGEVAAHTRETSELILDCQQMLERAEGHRHQAETSPEIEIRHRSLNQLDARLDLGGLVGKTIAAHLEHARREVEAGYRDSSARRGQQYATRAASEFENGAARFACGIDVKLDVSASPIWDNMVVEVGNRSVLIVRHD
jgi:hypothetical protein